MKNNIVSIITPTYNSSKYIEETIRSIINQTYTNWELLITDDCSSDNTLQIIEAFQAKDKRIKVFKLKTNSGAGVARNNSIRKASGKFIAFCDSDDKWLPNKLEKQINFLHKNNQPFTYSSYKVIDESGIFKEVITCPKKVTFQKMLRNNYVGCLTAIYDSEKLGKMYMPEIRTRQDWVLWLNILKTIKTAKGITEPLAIYTDRSNSISSNKIKLLVSNWKVYKNELGYNSIMSTILTFNFLIFYAAKKI